jgi:hypothetical protein
MVRGEVCTFITKLEIFVLRNPVMPCRWMFSPVVPMSWRWGMSRAEQSRVVPETHLDVAALLFFDGLIRVLIMWDTLTEISFGGEVWTSAHRGGKRGNNLIWEPDEKETERMEKMSK